MTRRDEDGNELVWSIFDNAWVTLDYWRYITNERARVVRQRQL